MAVVVETGGEGRGNSATSHTAPRRTTPAAPVDYNHRAPLPPSVRDRPPVSGETRAVCGEASSQETMLPPARGRRSF